MGYNDENSARLVFDIETAPIGDAATYLEPADAPANYKDPVKIAEYITAKNAENLDRCGLDVDLCRVVAIGYQSELTDDPDAWLCATENDERETLTRFWNAAINRQLIGFNCLAFDLPVLLRRSQYLGIGAPKIQIDKYKHPQVTDLQMVLSFNGAIRLRGLSFYAKRFGIQSEDTLTGADIAKAFAESRWADIQAHVIADVSKTAQLAAKLGYFRPLEAMAL